MRDSNPRMLPPEGNALPLGESPTHEEKTLELYMKRVERSTRRKAKNHDHSSALPT